jgi:hypothetical protein
LAWAALGFKADGWEAVTPWRYGHDNSVKSIERQAPRVVEYYRLRLIRVVARYSYCCFSLACAVRIFFPSNLFGRGLRETLGRSPRCADGDRSPGVSIHRIHIPPEGFRSKQISVPPMAAVLVKMR